MIDPSGFRSNEETREDNKFMAEGADSATDASVSTKVMAEWMGLVRALEEKGVRVTTFKGQGLPDEVFPNNWLSTHSDGRVVLYPMKVPSRAREVRSDVIDSIRDSMDLRRPPHDMTGWTASGIALEGTGSLVLDRPHRTAYMALSGRADKNLAELWARDMGYDLVTFSSTDRHGEEIYHTNVLLSVAETFAVICLDAIPDESEREAVVARLKSTGKQIIEATMEQMESFACNCIQLQGEGGTVLAISEAGWSSLRPEQQKALQDACRHIVAAPVPQIEKIGGGSVRCMIAELFPGTDAAAGIGDSVRVRDAEDLAAARRPERPSEVCRVNSEWDALDLVFVHEPGLEVDASMPWTLDAMKVDECFNRVDLKAQHRTFCNILRSRGAQVVYVRDLLSEIGSMGPREKRELFESVCPKEFLETNDIYKLRTDTLFTGYQNGALDFLALPLMNLFFMRDPAFAVPGGWVVISRPKYPIRQKESQLLRAMFKLHPGLQGIKVYDGLADDPDVSIEGGDVLVADDETVLVGISQRTNARGAERLKDFLFRETKVQRVIKVFIPKTRAFMHLDTLFTFVKEGTVLTMPYFWSEPEVYRELAVRANALITKMGSNQLQDLEAWQNPSIEVWERSRPDRPKKLRSSKALAVLEVEDIIHEALYVCGPEGSIADKHEHVMRALTEQWNDAANVFCISPGTVVAYKWCTRTIQHLQDRGVDVIELDGVELMKGRGGARCMTMPIRRSAQRNLSGIMA